MTRPAKTADEADAFSRRYRRYVRWKPGQIAAIKRQANRRERREGKLAVRDGRE